MGSELRIQGGSTVEQWVIYSESFRRLLYAVEVLVAESGCDLCRTVDTNDTEYTLPEEQEDYDWHTEGYYHNVEDETAS